MARPSSKPDCFPPNAGCHAEPTETVCASRKRVDSLDAECCTKQIKAFRSNPNDGIAILHFRPSPSRGNKETPANRSGSKRHQTLLTSPRSGRCAGNGRNAGDGRSPRRRGSTWHAGCSWCSGSTRDGSSTKTAERRTSSDTCGRKHVVHRTAFRTCLIKICLSWSKAHFYYPFLIIVLFRI